MKQASFNLKKVMQNRILKTLPLFLFAVIPSKVLAVSASITSSGMTITGGTLGTITDAENTVFDKLILGLNFATAFAASVLVLLFIKFIMDLANNGDNPQGRKAAIKGMIGVLIAAGMVGGASVFLHVGLGLFT